MSELNDHAYYASRANTAAQLADKASDPAIAAIHREMADKYRRLSEQAGKGRTKLHVVSD